MTDKEKLALVYKKYKKLYAGLFAIKFYLDKPFPDDDRWTPWTRYIEPYAKMMSKAFEGEDIGELSAWAEIGAETPVLSGQEWYDRFDEIWGEMYTEKKNPLTAEEFIQAAKKAAGIE